MEYKGKLNDRQKHILKLMSLNPDMKVGEIVNIQNTLEMWNNPTWYSLVYYFLETHPELDGQDLIDSCGVLFNNEGFTEFEYVPKWDREGVE